MITPRELNPEKLARWNKILAGREPAQGGCTPREAVYQRDRMVVYRYQGPRTPAYRPPVLLVYSLINRPYVMDLLPGRSVVGSLLEGGFDVYMLDWGIPDALDRYAGLDTHVNLLLRTAVREVCRHAGSPTVNILGYCMGGTLSAIYAALHPERVENLLLLGTPLRFRSEQLLYRWGTNPELFDPEKLVDAWGVAPAWSFEGYSLLTIDKKPAMLEQLYHKLDDEAFVESYKAMDHWVRDNISVPGAAYSEFIRECFHHDKLAHNRMELGGRRVRLGSLERPVLIIAGTADHLVPPETTGSRERLFPHQDAIEYPSGHIGLSVSRNSHRELWPRVTDWLADRCNRIATATP